MSPRYLTDRPPTVPRIKPQAAKGRLKLSTKCRQLEGKKGNFRKKFPFLRKLNVKGGIPSPFTIPPCVSKLCRKGLSTV